MWRNTQSSTLIFLSSLSVVQQCIIVCIVCVDIHCVIMCVTCHCIIELYIFTKLCEVQQYLQRGTTPPMLAFIPAQKHYVREHNNRTATKCNYCYKK